MALLADVAIVEVALRNSMHAALQSAMSTTEWYLLPMGFDDRSQAALSTAWSRVPAKIRTPGRLVAQLMFGFWSGLLDSGGYRGREPQRFKCDYEQLWRTILRKAFPGGRWMARAEGSRFSRLWVLETVRVVHATREPRRASRALRQRVPAAWAEDTFDDPAGARCVPEAGPHH